MPLKSRIKVLIADDMVELRSNVRRMLGSQEGFEVVGESSDGEETLKMARELSPHVILMDINMPKIDGLKATETLAKERPEIQVVMMSIQSEQEYFRRAMKAGAKDFLTKPFSGNDLVDTIQNVYSKWVKDRPEFQAVNQKKGHVITFFATKGGVGKTTMAVNLAVALALSGKKTLLMDCSLQFGDVAITLNLNASKNIFNIVEKEDYADYEKYLTSHSSGLKLLLAPIEPAYAEAIKAAHLKQILDILLPAFDYIIVDTAPHIGEIELQILDKTDLVFLMATLEISSLKNTKLGLKTLNDIKFDTSKIKLLLNKDIPNVGISSDDIQKGLSIPIFSVVPMDSESAQLSLNHGEPFTVKFPKSSLTKSIQDMCAKISSLFGETEVKHKVSTILKIKEILFGS